MSHLNFRHHHSRTVARDQLTFLASSIESSKCLLTSSMAWTAWRSLSFWTSISLCLARSLSILSRSLLSLSSRSRFSLSLSSLSRSRCSCSRLSLQILSLSDGDNYEKSDKIKTDVMISSVCPCSYFSGCNILIASSSTFMVWVSGRCPQVWSLVVTGHLMLTRRLSRTDWGCHQPRPCLHPWSAVSTRHTAGTW